MFNLTLTQDQFGLLVKTLGDVRDYCQIAIFENDTTSALETSAMLDHDQELAELLESLLAQVKGTQNV